MYKFALASAVAACCAILPAAVEINVSSEPALPAANLLKNASFEEEKLLPWRNLGGNLEIAADDKIAGNKVAKFTGDPAKSPNLWQNFKAKHIKAGDPMYVRFAAKNVGCDLDKKPAGMAWQAFMTNGKRQYLPGVSLPREEYDWAVFESVTAAPGDMRDVTFYLCYYKQEGNQFYDDVYVQGGTTELKISVKGENLASIKVRHSVSGTILREAIKGKEFSKTVKVPYFGSYVVEVTDKKGMQTSKLYPENVDTNRSGQNIVPLTPGKRISIASSPAESFNVELPADLKGKKVFMEFSARCHQGGPVAGYTGMLKVTVNGKVCQAAELVKPLNRSQTANGSEMTFARNTGYVVYYSNACYGISEDSRYCPVSLEDRNPFNFKLDITKLVKPGMNAIKLANTLPARMKKNIYVDNPVVVINENK